MCQHSFLIYPREFTNTPFFSPQNIFFNCNPAFLLSFATEKFEKTLNDIQNSIDSLSSSLDADESEYAERQSNITMEQRTIADLKKRKKKFH